MAEGYHTMQFAGAGDDYPVRQEIKAMYKKAGKEPPKEMETRSYYNRGLLNAAVHVEAIRNALKLNGGKKPTGERGQEGLRADPGLHAGRTGAAAQGHAGRPRGRRLGQIFQVKGGKFVKETEWFRAYRGMVHKAVTRRRSCRPLRDACPHERGRAGWHRRACWRSTTSKSSMTA